MYDIPGMPRKARIDAPGALHHIIVRGIERRKIFKDDTDRVNFLDRLGKVLSETGTKCFAWALIPNHFRLLLRTVNERIQFWARPYLIRLLQFVYIHLVNSFHLSRISTF